MLRSKIGEDRARACTQSVNLVFAQSRGEWATLGARFCDGSWAADHVCRVIQIRTWRAKPARLPQRGVDDRMERNCTRSFSLLTLRTPSTPGTMPCSLPGELVSVSVRWIREPILRFSFVSIARRNCRGHNAIYVNIRSCSIQAHQSMNALLHRCHALRARTIQLAWMHGLL